MVVGRDLSALFTSANGLLAALLVANSTLDLGIHRSTLDLVRWVLHLERWARENRETIKATHGLIVVVAEPRQGASCHP